MTDPAAPEQDVHQIPVRDEHPQQSNSDKTGRAMADAERTNTAPPLTEREGIELRQGEEPSGYRGESPASSGPGGTAVQSATPENAKGHLNPSAPANTGITPATSAE